MVPFIFIEKQIQFLIDFCFLVQVPSTENEWLQIASEFENQWNVFNTIGAIDGKHIRIKCPESGGSHFFNYKSYNSIVLFALVDANYKFLYVDIGTNGRVGDAGVYAKSKLKTCLTDRSILNIPAEKKLPNVPSTTPFVVLADDAFPLSYNVMKPYSMKNITTEERIFNYRLSRGRRMVESAFGILASRFRVFLTAINLSPEKVISITQAACTLHNLLVDKRRHLYTRQETRVLVEDGHNFLLADSNEELEQMEHVSKQISIGHNRHGKEIREIFKNFYNGPGKVQWQDKYIS